MATEKRLIDPNALVAIFEEIANEDESEYFHLDEITQEIFDAPTVDAVEVVHGRWIWDVETHGDPMYCVDEDFGYRCSECQAWADEYGVEGDIYEEPPTHILHYCPNCGAKMDGDNR